MKNKKQNGAAVEDSEQENGGNETTKGGAKSSSTVQLTEADKEQGNFKKFSLGKKMIKKLKARQVECLYPVQAKSYATIQGQKDCFIQASTGTGKTLAFSLPLVELLQSDDSVELVAGRAPRVVVVVPTREATKQVSEDFQSLVNNLTVATLFTSKKKTDEQDAALAEGSDILVATPDRLKEVLEQEKLDAAQVKHVVLDEMDQMLDATVVEDVKKVLKHVFAAEQETKVQLIVLSESLPDSVRKLTKKYVSDDVVTLNLLQGTTKEAAEDADDNEDEEEEDEPFVPKKKGAAGQKTETGSKVSLLSKQENYTTYQLTAQDELRGAGFVFTMLRKCFGEEFDGKSTCAKVAFTTDFKSAVFDLPSELDEQLQGYWKDSARIQMGPITELPELDEASMSDNTGFSRGGGARGKPSYGGGGGGANRNDGRSNTCFKCQKEGHKSFECTEGGGGGSSYQNGNRGGGGSGCFNCGKEGHRSFECTEPKKAGGRPGGGGGERSNACFNCGKEGHKSFECSEPKKAGGRPGGGGGERSNACFNCGQEGHRSFECSEPKKERSSGFGGRGGGRGGSRGGRGGGGGGWDGGAKRSFNGGNDNSFSSGEAANKKIKFDDDD